MDMINTAQSISGKGCNDIMGDSDLSTYRIMLVKTRLYVTEFNHVKKMYMETSEKAQTHSGRNKVFQQHKVFQEMTARWEEGTCLLIVSAGLYRTGAFLSYEKGKWGKEGDTDN